MKKPRIKKQEIGAQPEYVKKWLCHFKKNGMPADIAWCRWAAIAYHADDDAIPKTKQTKMDSDKHCQSYKIPVNYLSFHR